ncbi:erythromycin esterase family protein (plasmid) [Deinococcus sp. KNUC1210]|uniref:erythromycin esterase family protein n=1 Tax=Deinococcus sp. KNUC1210 TaxID=2917691 RepID=UPI001EEFFB0D|nr:erythromycin esterase family protein [Deinococcus sp. KNUC1210]ULH14053.1 erythromycin esterase family protein [Deinococcus sp. KNUC1210]
MCVLDSHILTFENLSPYVASERCPDAAPSLLDGDAQTPVSTCTDQIPGRSAALTDHSIGRWLPERLSSGTSPPTLCSHNMLPLRLFFLGTLLGTTVTLASTLPFQNLGLNVVGFADEPRDWLVLDRKGTTLDRTVKHEGAFSLKLKAVSSGQLAGISWNAKPWRGQTVVLSGWFKSRQSQATFLFETCPTESCPGDGHTPLSGTHDWTNFSLTLQIPQTAEMLAVGIRVSSGTLWLDDLSLTANGQPIAEAPPFMGPDATELAWLKDNSQPLRTETAAPDQSSADDTDLAPLGAVVGHARLIGLGEGTHGTHEFFTLKQRMVQYLVKRQGIRVFALEANAALADTVNAYIQGGPGKPESLLAGTVWHTEEMLNLLKWMRLYNKTTQNKLILTGFDLGFNSNLSELNVIQELVATVEPTYLSKVQDLLTSMSRDYYYTYAPINANKTANYQADRTMAETILLHFEHQKALYQHMLSVEQYQLLLRYVTRVWQFTGMPLYGPYTYRDRMMARNLEAIAHQYPGKKIVVWAHDVHVGRFPGRMGELLTQDLGAQYAVIGTMFGSGRYTAGPGIGQPLVEGNLAPPMYLGSIEQAFSQVGAPFFLDLRTTRSLPAAWLNREQDMRVTIGTSVAPFDVVRGNLAHLFDAVAFVPFSTSSKLLK